MIRDLVTAYMRWALLRAAVWRGYWVVTALYLVVVAKLTPFQLVLIGTCQAFTGLVCEVPAGAAADTVSRRFALVVGHVVMACGMVLAGMVTAFPLLVLSQCLCGVGWAFCGGADVAWLTDEVATPRNVDRLLAAQARWELLGQPLGVVAFGSLAWATTLATAIVCAGVVMALLGLLGVAHWPESGFVPSTAKERNWHATLSTVQRGVRLATTDRLILGLAAATALVNGGGEVYGRLFERRLLRIGMPIKPDPIVWFGALSVVGFLLGAATLHAVERRIDGASVARGTYVLACVAGLVGLLVFANAPNLVTAVAGALLVSGIVQPVIRAAATILVNRQATRDVRATVNSLLLQAEHAGEIVLGFSLAIIAATTSTSTALAGSATMFGIAAWAVARNRRPARA